MNSLPFLVLPSGRIINLEHIVLVANKPSIDTPNRGKYLITTVTGYPMYLFDIDWQYLVEHIAPDYLFGETED